MNRKIKCIPLIALLILTLVNKSSICCQNLQNPESRVRILPRVFLLNPHDLAAARQNLFAGDKTLSAALEKLRDKADQALQADPLSVMDKPATPPSGDKHDYMSLATYWWPDPNSEDGLPYIWKDGISNPEYLNYDRIPLKKTIKRVTTLALAYYYSDYEPYAAHAATLLRVWFLNEETRMNPHLQHAQIIKGVNKGRGVGIIDTRRFTQLGEAIGLISHSNSWTATDQSAMERWFEQYLNWLVNSNHGKNEADRKHNHGTWYDVLTTYLALFINNDILAKEILEKFPQRRIAVQIEPDGRQPMEIKRTRSFNYSVMNLKGLFYAALLGEHLGLDIWRFRTKDGRCIRNALDYLMPFAIKQKKWPFQMIRGWNEDNFETIFFLLRIAEQKYQHPEYEKMIEKLPYINAETNWINLLYPNTTENG
ncbi:hypothetical protein GF407_06920 [candidate division KSB1 bacterium]|nr:hypothetical protein [candidate division KSB1 bacterium]